MKKHRQYQRYIVTGNGHILNSKQEKAEFLIKDISASGINLVTDMALEEHETVMIDIIISGSFMPYSKQLKGKVMRKHREHPLCHYAVSFLELARKDVIEIDEYLRFNQSSSKLRHPAGEAENDIPSNG